MMRCKPSLSAVTGSHPSASRARVISGFRCCGSSLGRGLYSSFEPEPHKSTTMSVSSRMVNSRGFPQVYGLVKSSGVCMSLVQPSIMSSA
jgi:hypothetical protein